MTVSPAKAQATESLLINRITAQPESVFAIIRSLAALSPDGPMATETLRDITAPELKASSETSSRSTTDPWKENMEAAALLGTVELSGGTVQVQVPLIEPGEFKRLVRRRMRQWEDEGNPNANCFGAMRVALGMTLSDNGFIPFDSFIAGVNHSLGPLPGSDVRAFNREKARTWLRWVRFSEMAVGKGTQFVPYALARFRAIVEELEHDRDYSLREFLLLAENEVPCTTEPVSKCNAGPLPPTTVAGLSLLEMEQTIQLMPIGDAEDVWIFPDERRLVTHLRLITRGDQG